MAYVQASLKAQKMQLGKIICVNRGLEKMKKRKCKHKIENICHSDVEILYLNKTAFRILMLSTGHNCNTLNSLQVS